MKNQRNLSLDIISGILIIYMMTGHLLEEAHLANKLDGSNIDLLFFFFMPWFSYKGGMFFKYNKNNKIFIKNSFDRLIIPFIFFGIIGLPLYYLSIVTGSHGDNLSWYLAPIKIFFLQGTFCLNGPIWFLLSLFIVRIVYNFFFNYRGLNWIFAMLSAAIPFASYITGFNSLLILTHTMLVFFFFHWGYILRIKQYNIRLFILAITGYLVLSIACPNYVTMHGNILRIGDNYLLYFPYALAAIVVYNNVFKYVTPPYMFTKYQNWQVHHIFAWGLSNVGCNSMNYLVTHQILISAIRILMINILCCNYDWAMLLIMVISCIIILPFISSLLNQPSFDWIMGRK